MIRITEEDFSPETIERQLKELEKGSGHNDEVKLHMKFYTERQWEMFHEAMDNYVKYINNEGNKDNQDK